MLDLNDISTTIEQLRKQLVLALRASPFVMGNDNKTTATVIHRLADQGQLNLDAGASNKLADLMPQITQAATVLPERLYSLVHCVAELEAHLPWYQRPIANNPKFMESHSNAQIIGPEGIEVRHDLIVGVTLMRPNVAYPDHQHEPEELYLVLSEGVWRQAYGPWYTPGVGDLVYNPSDVFHGMHSADAPLFALWCLPLDKPFTSFSAPLPMAS
jgi:hypothetical protein